MTGSAEPRRIGRYALHGELASGGMATVYLGKLIGPVGFSRTVAIKSLHPQYAKDPEFVAMFLDEARLAARIQHPNVVSTLDVVALKEQVFLVMDYVQGETFARLIRGAGERGGHVPPPIATAIAAGALLGLHAAHEATNERGEPLDIVHRDVSPQNVIVGVDGIARVLDFGVAKATERLIQTTREGRIKGKLPYMAPEQLRGGHVNRQTDIYAASVMLWEALTGERLIAGETEGEILDRLSRGDVEPPSLRAGPLPAGLDAIVLKGLSRERQDRFSTAREMAVALQACGVGPATEVGEWVEGQAVDALAERARRVAEIECDSDDGLTEAHRILSSVASPSAASGEATAADTSVDVAGSVSRHAGRYLALAAMALATLVVAFFVRAAMRRAKPEAGPNAAASESAAPETVAPASDDSALRPTSVTSPATAPSSVPASPRSPPATKPGCNPPYTLNPSGRKTYKRNCL